MHMDFAVNGFLESPSSTGNHTIAVVNGSESRETLEESFRDVFNEANDIIEKGYIEIDGRRVSVEFYLGGDYKVSFTIFDLILQLLPYY